LGGTEQEKGGSSRAVDEDRGLRMTLTRLDRYGAERSALGTEGGGVTAGTRLTANAEEEEEEREEGIGAHPPTRGPTASEAQGGPLAVP